MPLTPRINIRRVRRIVRVFYELGFGAWIRRLKLHYIVPLHKRWMRFFRRKEEIPCPMETEIGEYMRDLPVHLRLACERLGGTFVKFGQMLSLRGDLVGQSVADELRKLQDRVPSFSVQEAKATIERELGKPIKILFKNFTETPVGSASLAQVHHAVLPNGREVAVKILRPGIENLVRQDIVILQWVARLLEDHLAFTRSYQPRKVIDEFAEWTTRELNLLNEAVNIEHFRKLYEGEEDILIPGVVWEYTSRRVLTTEFSHGIPMDDLAKYREVRSSRKKIAALGVRLVVRQYFEHGFFHGDPHPGNFFVLPNNRVCLHDFGIVGRIDTKTRRELIGCYVDFFEKDAEGAIDHVLHLAKTDAASDIDGFRREVTGILEQWFYAPTAGERLSTAFYKMVISGGAHGIIFPSNIVLLAKAIVTTESMALLLDPAFDIAGELKPYLNRLLTFELKPEKLAKRGRELLLDSANILDDIPDAARTLLKLAEKEEVGVRLETREFLDIKREIDRQSDIRMLTLLFVADLLATAVLLHLEGIERIGGVPIAFLGILFGAALGVMVLMKIKKRAD